MGKKLKDLSQTERKAVSEEINTGAAMIGQDSWDTAVHLNSKSNNRLGLCSDCINANVIITEYGTTYANCERFEIPLSGRDPVVSCTRYTKRGSLTIQEMESMAILLETNKKEVGFLSGD